MSRGYPCFAFFSNSALERFSSGTVFQPVISPHEKPRGIYWHPSAKQRQNEPSHEEIDRLGKRVHN
jgi:hypothetical protein